MIHHVNPPPPGGFIDKTAAIGWMGTFGSVFMLGSYGLLIKSKEVVDAAVDPFVFQLYYSMGVVSCSVLIWLVRSGDFVWSMWGMVFGGLWVGCQVFCYLAINLLGYAVGPAIWAGTTIVISFLWGTIFFHETPSSVMGASLSLLVLCLGVAIVSLSATSTPQVIARALSSPKHRKKDNDDDDGDVVVGEQTVLLPPTMRNNNVDTTTHSWNVDNVPLEKRAHVKVLLGLICAIMAGLLNGSLMVPLRCFSNGGCGVDQSDRWGMYNGKHNLASVDFLPSLSIGIITITPIFFISYVSIRWILLLWQQQGEGGEYETDTVLSVAVPPLHASVAAIPGVLTGVFWACGNFCSFFATLYLGQTIGFPLTQTCIVVCGFCGILVFDELQGSASRVCFGFGVVLVVIGAVLDSQFS